MATKAKVPKTHENHNVGRVLSLPSVTSKETEAQKG